MSVTVNDTPIQGFDSDKRIIISPLVLWGYFNNIVYISWVGTVYLSGFLHLMFNNTLNNIYVNLVYSYINIEC